jgi:5'-nucleotidase/UDP-sugar diphosphatase
VARRATVIEAERAAAQRLLLLDAGNALTGQTLADSSKGKLVVEAMNRLGYTAMTIAEGELQLGLDELGARMKEAKFAMLSANLVVKSTGQLLAQPYVIVELKGLKVGILGLTNDNAAKIKTMSVGAATTSASANIENQVSITDPLAAAQKYVPEVAKQADMVIVLSHLGVDWDQKLAEQIPGISVIVGGSTKRVLSPLLTVKDTLIGQAGYQGEWVGRIYLDRDAKGSIGKYDGQVLTLGPEYADNQEMARWLEETKKKAP